MSKVKTVTLTAGHRIESEPVGVTGYRVERVTDTVEFAPGDIVTKKVVADLCDSKQWKVIVQKVAA